MPPLSQRKANSLKKDAAYVYSGWFLRYLSVIFLTPYYARVLGPASYGKVLATMSLTGIVVMVVNYGLSATGARELALEKDESRRGEIFGRQTMARLLLIPVGAVIGIAGTFLSPSLAHDPWYGILGTFIGILSAMNLGWFFQGLRQFRTSVTIEALVYPINIVLVVSLVHGPQDGIFAVISSAVAGIVTTLVAYILAFRNLKATKVIFKDGFREIKYASVIFLQSINSMLMTAGSTYLLSALSSPEQVGFFGSSEKLVSFSLAFLAPAGQILMPTIAYRSAHSPEEVPRLIRRAVFLEIGYGICACIGGFFLAPFIIPLAFGSQFHASVALMKTLVWFLPFAAFTHAFGLYVLIPQKKEKWLVLAITIGNAVNLLMIALLAHAQGAAAVAYSRVTGECLSASVLVIIAIVLKRRSFVARADALEIAHEIIPEEGM